MIPDKIMDKNSLIRHCFFFSLLKTNSLCLCCPNAKSVSYLVFFTMARKIYEGLYSFFMIIHLEAEFAVPLMFLKNSNFLFES